MLATAAKLSRASAATFGVLLLELALEVRPRSSAPRLLITRCRPRLVARRADSGRSYQSKRQTTYRERLRAPTVRGPFPFGPCSLRLPIGFKATPRASSSSLHTARRSACRVPRQLAYKSVKYLSRITLTDFLSRVGDGRGSAQLFLVCSDLKSGQAAPAPCSP